MVNFINSLISKLDSGAIQDKFQLLNEIWLAPDNVVCEKLWRWVAGYNGNEFSVLSGHLKAFLETNQIFYGRKIAKFGKVSFNNFKESVGKYYSDEEEIKSIYDSVVTLPKRATRGSAGYDFVSPISFILKPGESIKIPTGINCMMHSDWVLKVYPRSGLGFKYRAQLDNTVGIIDSDYIYSDNEGHIYIKVTNDSKEGKEFCVEAGTAFCQGIFVEYGLTLDDDVSDIRNGGFGSTSK